MKYTTLHAALESAARGLRVIPIHPEKKVTLIKDWPCEATADQATIRQWFGEWPDANIATPPDRRAAHRSYMES
jgi:hypothetical protein